MQSVESLDLEGLVSDIRAGKEFQLLHRNGFRFRCQSLVSWDDEPLETTGSQGFHCCWLEQGEGGVGYRLRLGSLRDGTREPNLGWDMSESLHTLNLPVRMDSLVRMLAFCDETATIFILTTSCSMGCCPRALRTFEF